MRTLTLLALLLIQGPLTQDGVVTGQIRALTQEPAANVRVVAIAAPTPGAADQGIAVFESISQTDASGRYRLEHVPPGRYFVSAGLIDLPTYYPGVKTMAEARVVTVAAGDTVGGIDFVLAQTAGVRIFGRVSGVPEGTAAGLVRVTLLPAAGTRLPAGITEAQVQTDGSFEFRRVSPGKYNLRLLPSLPPVTMLIDIQDQDVGPLALSLPLAISGQVVVEGGGDLPVPKNVPAGLANFPPLLALQARRTDSSAALSTPLRSDGTFLWMMPAGEYELGVTMLPFGYRVKSMEYGNVNLLDSPLKITDSPENRPPGLHITLTTTPLPGEPEGVNVSGNVLGIPGSPSSGRFWVRLQTSIVPSGPARGIMQRVADAQVRDDGTFEVFGVPPGVYSAQVFQEGAPPISGSMAIVVEDSDVVGAQLVANPAPILPTQPTGPTAAIPLSSSLASNPLPSTDPRGVGVRGRVRLSSGGAYPDAVVLFPSRPGAGMFQAPVQKDGSFEFRNVPPGLYDARTLPLSAPPISTAVQVELRDLTVEIPVPALSELRGHIALQDGRPVLTGLGIRLLSPGGSVTIPVTDDGRFSMKINHGEYQLSVVQLPPNYVVRTVTQGETDLLKASYKTSTEGEILITIEAVP